MQFSSNPQPKKKKKAYNRSGYGSLASDAEGLGLAQSRAVATVETCSTVSGSRTSFQNLRKF